MQVSRRSLVIVAAAIACISFSTPVNAKKNWNKVDYEKAERELEADDDPELLVSDETLIAAEMEKRKNAPMRPPEGAALKDPTEWVKHQQAMSGPAMLFCTLKKENPRNIVADFASSGKSEAEALKIPQGTWPKVSVEMTAYEWRELLKTAGLEAQVYDISEAGREEAGTQPRILVTTPTGWRGYELRDFVLQQREVEEIEWDQVKYTPEDIATLEANKGKAAGAPPMFPPMGFGGKGPTGSSSTGSAKKKTKVGGGGAKKKVASPSTGEL